MRRLTWLGLLAIVLASCVSLGEAHAENLSFPVLSGHIVDEAGVLSSRTKADLSRQLQTLETQTSDQVLVVTLTSLRGVSLEDYGYQLGRHWQLGVRGRDNGALLIIVPSAHLARIEVGYGLEGVLTDALTKIILERAILPQLRSGDYDRGVRDGVTALVNALSSTPAGEISRPPNPAASTSSGKAIVVWVLLGFLALLGIGAPAGNTICRQILRSLLLVALAGRGSGRGGGRWGGKGGSFGGGGASGRW